MARLITAKKIISAIYDFAVDGGAISTIGLGVFIPNNSVITNFFVKTNTTPTSAGAATISFGWTGDTDALMIVNAMGNFVATESLQGRDFADTPVEVTANRQVAIDIVTAALTAGVIIATVEFVEIDI